MLGIYCNRMSHNRSTHTSKRTNMVNRPTPQRPIIDLGDTRSESFGEWLYNHRIGLIVTMVSLLLCAGYMLASRYEVELRPVEYFVEFVDEVPSAEEVERLKRQRDKLQEEIERRMAAMQNIQNKQSNEAAEKSGAEHQTQYDSDMQQMMDKIASDMATNRDAYNSGMRDIKGMGSGDGEGGNSAAKGDGDKGRFEGAVTVSYNFDNPVRHHRDLYVPAYRARGGGIVVVDAWIDRNGTVTAARIASSTNAELNEQALAAARHRRTLFRIEGTAPTSHRGTITYTFVAQ